MSGFLEALLQLAPSEFSSQLQPLIDEAAAELADLEKANKDFFRANFKLTGQIAAKDARITKLEGLLLRVRPVIVSNIDGFPELKYDIDEALQGCYVDEALKEPK